MIDSMVTALVPEFLQWMERVRPASLLAAGPAARAAAAQWAQQHTVEVLTAEVATLPERHVDLAVVDASAFRGPPDVLLRHVALLRDCRAGVLLLAVSEGDAPAGWRPADGFALGLRLERRIAAPPLLLFSFALATYKPAPEWLNSKYWAHPERFDAPEPDGC